MPTSTKTLAVLTYPLALVARAVNLILRRDRLNLHDVPSNESFWIERHTQPDTASYFSERSCSEGGTEPSAAKALTELLRGIARLHRPPRKVAEGIYKASAEREQGIPDEVYT